MIRSMILSAGLGLLPVSLFAEPPRVVADIAPVHSLAAQVIEGVGTPDLLLRPGASPHGYAMRPSEAAALQSADVILWIGPDLTPWLDRAMSGLSGDARRLSLLDAPGGLRLESREIAVFGAGDAHSDHEEHHDGHDHEEHGHEEQGHGDHEEHGEEAGHEHDHHHGSVDPHAWLDPRNAQVWLGLIAEALAEQDPANAETYRANAARAQAELDTLVSEIDAQLAPVRGAGFLVYHDAYQYFEERFDIHAAGAIATSDAVSPGAARLAELRQVVEAKGITCAFHEPQFSPRLVAALSDGTGLRSSPLDPVGTGIEPGTGFYAALLSRLASSMTECLGGA